MKNVSRKYIYIFIQLVLYGTFLTLDLSARNMALSNRIKFAVIFLCFVYVITNGKENPCKWNIYLRYAMALTVVSDAFILMSDYYVYGVLTFILAQELYGLRISALNTGNQLRNLFFRLLFKATLSTLIYIALWVNDFNINLLLIVSLFYFISISTNVFGSIKLYRDNKGRRDIKYFAIGMVLFLLCDINVGLFNLSNFISVGSAYKIIYNISSILMWTFYGPSQILISLSGDSNRQKAQ